MDPRAGRSRAAPNRAGRPDGSRCARCHGRRRERHPGDRLGPIAKEIGQIGAVLGRTPEQLQRWQSSWIQWIARDEQIPPPGDWRTWLYLAGRGAGKTRSGAEWIHEQVGAGRRRIALVAPTAADVRDVMVEGESGILAIGSDRLQKRSARSARCSAVSSATT